MDIIQTLLAGNLTINKVIDILLGKARADEVELIDKYVVQRYDLIVGGKLMKFVDQDAVTGVFRDLGMKDEEFPFDMLRKGLNTLTVKSGGHAWLKHTCCQ